MVAQLNGPDTAAHLYGPDSDEALDAYRYTDTAIATVREALAPRWDDWVVVVVSDHSQETATDEAIDLEQEMKSRGVDGRIILDGSAAVVTGEGGSDPRWLDDVDAVVGVEPLADDTAVVWGRPGSPSAPTRGLSPASTAARGPRRRWRSSPAATAWCRPWSSGWRPRRRRRPRGPGSSPGSCSCPTVGGIPRLPDAGSIPG